MTTAFAEVNFVEKVSGHARRACVARFARRFVQKCELFWIFRISCQSEFLNFGGLQGGCVSYFWSVLQRLSFLIINFLFLL